MVSLLDNVSSILYTINKGVPLMGMDVYGRNPVIKEHSVKPVRPDWTTATAAEKSVYFEAAQQYETENPGVYFRANCWSWRPIHDRVYQADREYDLCIDEKTLELMGENSGAGLDNQEDCDRLAEALENVLEREDDILTWNCGDPKADREGWYKAHKEHALEFVDFLRGCGGFEVC
tara:strand:- start:21 stop:548 length:528 start_codon:yes stop_codon:yes gene_type:complete